MSTPREILCVCYGNICRSPMAEALLQVALDQRFGPGRFTVSSAGIGAQDGAPADKRTLKALEQRGIDGGHLRATKLTPEIIDRVWRVYCMEEYQAGWIRTNTQNLEKVMLMGEEIPDPLGRSQRKFEAVAKQIERLIPAILDDIERALAAEQASPPRG